MKPHCKKDGPNHCEHNFIISAFNTIATGKIEDINGIDVLVQSECQMDCACECFEILFKN